MISNKSGIIGRTSACSGDLGNIRLRGEDPSTSGLMYPDICYRDLIAGDRGIYRLAHVG